MSIFIQTCTMDEVPHLSEEAKLDELASTPPYLRDARMKGYPVLGAGLIYDIPEDDIKVAASSIRITSDWPRCFAMDVSFNKTAVAWFAREPQSKIVYLHDCHYQGREEPAIHVEAIKSRGAWIPGVIDPRADNRSVDDSKQLFRLYTQHYGLNLIKAEVAVTTGISEVWQMLVGGQLKVSDAASLAPFWKELRMYRTKADKDGNVSVVKQDDHLMDCLAGETLVLTDRGHVPIRTLVGTEGKVLGPSGWNDYSDCRLYRRNSRIVKVEFSDGRSVICTPDHKFLTPHQWVQAAGLTGMECYDIVSQCVHHSGFENSPQPARNFKDFITTFAESIFNAMVLGFTGPFGRLQTAGLSPGGLMFTTKIPTEAIISHKTSNYCPVPNISAAIKEVTEEESRLRLLRLLENGTNQKLDRTGTATIMQQFRALFYMSKNGSSVNSAGKSSRRTFREETDFALVLASRLGDALLDSIQNREVADFAGPNSQSIANTKKHSIVPENARGVRVKRISDAGLADTYCLNAHQDHAFAVERGIVVHNCLRYFVMSGLNRMQTSNGISDSRSRYLEVFLGRSGNRRGLSWMAG